MLSTAAGANVVYARNQSLVSEEHQPQWYLSPRDLRVVRKQKEKNEEKKKLCGLYPFHVCVKYAVFTLPK